MPQKLDEASDGERPGFLILTAFCLSPRECNVLNVSPQNSQVEPLTPNVMMVLGGEGVLGGDSIRTRELSPHEWD